MVAIFIREDSGESKGSGGVARRERIASFPKAAVPVMIKRALSLGRQFQALDYDLGMYQRFEPEQSRLLEVIVTADSPQEIAAS